MNRADNQQWIRTGRGILLAITLLSAGVPRAADETWVQGRVRITAVPDAGYALVRQALEARYAPAAGALPSVRIVSLRRREDAPDRYDATIYDYSTESAFDVSLDAQGVELGKKLLKEQPGVTPDELRDAKDILAKKSPWAAGIANGTIQVYESMPPVYTDKEGRRRVNLGVMARPEGSWNATENEIVSVHLPTGDLFHHADGAPRTALAPSLVCGPPSQGCGASVGSCGSVYHFEWPAANPVWKFDAMHPSCTSSVQGDGTGLELQNVFYRDRLVLKRADVPVLNVQYDNNTCGPYRDWLTSESCFTSVGTPVGTTGFVVGAGSPDPATFCEQATDSGNFVGVDIHDQGDALWLITETSAGWYRYVMEWRLHLDGTIEPIFGFGATSNGCTCNTHNHHAYWRFEWAIDGSANDPATGINILEHQVAGSQDWLPVTTESTITRPASQFTADLLRIKSPQSGSLYTVYPGVEDGSAQGDAYAKADAWALAYNAGEINDPNSGTAIGIDPWVNGESLGASKRLVLWYRGGYRHDYNGGDIEPCELVGPRMVFRRPCEGLFTLVRSTASCSDVLPIVLEDSDLAGAGTQTVSVHSATEPAGETVTLVESPAGSGRFTGSVGTTAAPASGVDGLLSVVDADTITIDYTDASACGTLNVGVSESVTVDCAPPVISNVQAVGITESSATITWTTNEPANSSVAYGTSAPPGATVADPASFGTAHSLVVPNLQACATELFRVASADPVGNTAVDTNGGAYYHFQVNGRGYAVGPDDVEAGTGVFTASGTAGTLWHRDTCKSSSPTHAWKAGSSSCPGTYGNLADTYLTSASIALGATGAGYHLRFQELFGTEAGFDTCAVQISTNGGSSWNTIDSYSGSSAGWRARDYDLSAYSGSVLLRFWFHSDSGTVAEGWYIDDIDISRSAPCGASLSRAGQSSTDSCAGAAGNGVLDPAEDVRLQITARNNGMTGATHVAATLSTTTPGAVVTGPTVTFPDLAPNGGSAANDGAGFALTLGSGISCGALVDLTIHFTADQGAWDDSLQLRVGSGGSGVHAYPSADTPKAINDNATTTSQIAVANPGTVSDVNVTLGITHTFDGDLQIDLVAPTGTRVPLSSRNGSSGNNYTSTVFDDQAAVSITSGSPPFTGTFRPQSPLSVLNGITASGTWRLEVADMATVDTGTLNSWTLTLTTSDPYTCSSCSLSAPPEVPALSWSAGSDALGWTTLPSASWYDLQRGSISDLPALLDATADSCNRYRGTTADSGAILTEVPAAGGVYWYLVTASNGVGTGGAGNATAGPRVVNGAGVCP